MRQSILSSLTFTVLKMNTINENEITNMSIPIRSGLRKIERTVNKLKENVIESTTKEQVYKIRRQASYINK
jgi:hypothetical protein